MLMRMHCTHATRPIPLCLCDFQVVQQRRTRTHGEIIYRIYILIDPHRAVQRKTLPHCGTLRLPYSLARPLLSSSPLSAPSNRPLCFQAPFGSLLRRLLHFSVSFSLPFPSIPKILVFSRLSLFILALILSLFIFVLLHARLLYNCLFSCDLPPRVTYPTAFVPASVLYLGGIFLLSHPESGGYYKRSLLYSFGIGFEG